MIDCSLTPIGSDLKGKTAIVTGGATGIGKAIAMSLAAHGVRIAIADLNPEAARTTAAQLGKEARAFDLDVSKRASVEMTFTKIERTLGSPETGSGAILTAKGRDVLQDPQALERLRAGLPVTEADRGAVVRRALRGPAFPLVT